MIVSHRPCTTQKVKYFIKEKTEAKNIYFNNNGTYFLVLTFFLKKIDNLIVLSNLLQ